MGSWGAFFAGWALAIIGSAGWDAVCHVIDHPAVRRVARKRPVRRRRNSGDRP